MKGEDGVEGTPLPTPTPVPTPPYKDAGRALGYAGSWTGKNVILNQRFVDNNKNDNLINDSIELQLREDAVETMRTNKPLQL